MIKKKNLLLVMLIFLISTFMIFSSSLSVNAASSVIPPSDVNLHYTGRIDKSNPEAVNLIWEGTTIKANFQGTSLKMQLENYSDNYLNVFIDNNLTIVKCLNGNNLYTLASGLQDTVHSVEIFKRTEAGLGAVTFKGFILDEGKQLVDSGQANNFKIEFYGDSITVGACDEDLEQDQWGDHSTHNNYMAYGAIAARTLNAEYMCTAVSGIGLTHGFQKYTMPEIWDRVWYDSTSAAWDFSSWQANCVVINLGENDRSAGIVGDFSAAYVKFIKNIRGKYPKAAIFCVLGPMAVGQNPDYFDYVSAAVNTLKSEGDNNVFFHNFSQSVNQHPRVATNIQVADELVNVIKASMNIQVPNVPTAPKNLTTLLIPTQRSVRLVWSQSTDKVGVVGYEIYNGSTLVGSSKITDYIVTGLTEKTTYSFTVKAKNVDQNLSAASNALSVTTSANGDVNRDGKINILDYAFIKSFLLRKNLVLPGTFDSHILDINTDNNIDLADYDLLKRILIKK